MSLLKRRRLKSTPKPAPVLKPHALGLLIREKRQAIGWTVMDLETRLNELGVRVTDAAISNWETGRASEIKGSNLIGVMYLLKITPEELYQTLGFPVQVESIEQPPSIMKVEWRDIQGFEGRYQISNHGEVYSCSKNRVMTRGKRHLPHHATLGRGKGLGVQFYQIKDLVYSHFVGPIPEGMKVEYKDGNVLNKRVDNLILVEE